MGFASRPLPEVVAEAFRAAVSLDLRATRELLEAAGGGIQIVHRAPGLEIRVEVLTSPGPGSIRLEHGDALYLALDGSGILGTEAADPIALVPGEAVVVPGGVKYALFGNPRLSMLVVSSPGWRPVAPLAVCRSS